MTETPEEFAALLDRVRHDDAAALAELVRRYEPALRRIASSRLGPALRARLDWMDLVQSVHREMIPGLREGRFDLVSSEKLIGLAIKVLTRKIARHWDRLQREREVLGRAADRGDAADCRTPGPPAEDPARAAELRDLTEHILHQLEEEDRRLLLLRLEGYCTAAAASKLGLDADCCRVRLSRLRRRLLAAGLPTDWF